MCYPSNSNWLDHSADTSKLIPGDTFQLIDSENDNWYEVTCYSDCGETVYGKLRGMGYTRSAFDVNKIVKIRSSLP